MKRRRTQGRWDPAEKLMQFAASGDLPLAPELYLTAVNDLYGEAGDRIMEGTIGQGYRVLLDSGVFNLTNDHMRATGITMDEALAISPEDMPGFDKLFARYVELAQRWGDDLWGYIELDQGGAANKRITRAKLHDLGLDPIPVYHPLNDGWDYFDELAEQYDRICVGNLVQANQAQRTRILHTMWERHRAYPDLWIHALGVTPYQVCLPFPPDSADSSSWINGLRWPAVDMGSAMLARQGKNWDDGFRYALGVDGARTAPPIGVTDRHDRPLTRCSTAAVGVYADEVEFMTRLWRNIAADREAELGAVSFPARMTNEGELCPATQ